MPANLRIADAETAPVPDEHLYEPLLAGQLSPGSIAIVENIHRSFLKSAEVELSELLQAPVTLSFEETIQSPFSAVLGSAGSADRAVELELSPLQGSGYLMFSSLLLFRVLDILLATPENTSSDDGSDQPRRPVTGIELYILRDFFEVFARCLRDVWAPIYPAAFHQMPAPVEEAGPGPRNFGDDLALVLRANIDLAGMATEVRLILPTFLARMAHQKSAATVGRDGLGEPFGGSIVKCLGGASLSMDAVLRGGSIRIRDLLGMTPGQILVTGNSEDAAFECTVNGREQFTGALVASSGRCALRIDTLTGQTESQLTEESLAAK